MASLPEHPFRIDGHSTHGEILIAARTKKERSMRSALFSMTKLAGLVGAAYCFLSLGASPAHAGKTCPGANCYVANDYVNCASYTETLAVTPTTPAAATSHTELAHTETVVNCSSTVAATGTHRVSYTKSESITHSKNGELSADVGLALGSDAVGKLSLGMATTHANGWQKVDTYSQVFETTANYNVPGCRKQTWNWWRTYKDGTFSKSGQYNYSVQVADAWYQGWWWITGSCKATTSTASGINRNVGLTLEIGPIQTCSNPQGPCAY